MNIEKLQKIAKPRNKKGYLKFLLRRKFRFIIKLWQNIILKFKSKNPQPTRITKENYIALKKVHCDKGKHRFRENAFGITWCVICGQLSYNNQGLVPKLKEEDKLIICDQTL